MKLYMDAFDLYMFCTFLVYLDSASRYERVGTSGTQFGVITEILLALEVKDTLVICHYLDTCDFIF